MQETQVRSLTREDPVCLGATKPMFHNYWACTREPGNHSYWGPGPQLLKPARSSAHAPQEKPPQSEAHTRQLETSPHSPSLEKSPHSNKDAAQSKLSKQFFFKKHLRGIFGLRIGVRKPFFLAFNNLILKNMQHISLPSHIQRRPVMIFTN